MGAGSFLALVARHALPSSTRAPSSKNPAQVHHSIDDSTPHAGQQQALQLLRRFQLDLAERLQLLQLHGSGNAHLNWLLDALASALSTHSSLQTVLTAAAASSSAPSAPTLAIKHRADEMLSLLDVCASLKQVADDIDRRFDGFHQALQNVRSALNEEKPLSSGRMRAAARKLSVCLTEERPHASILCITGKQYRSLAEARASLLLASKTELHSCDATPADPLATLLGRAVDGTILSSLLVLASAVSSLSPSSPRKSSGPITGACKMIIKYLSVKSEPAVWAAPLRQLHRDLKQEEMSAVAGSLFQEVQGLHSEAVELHALITNPGVDAMEIGEVTQSVESLRKRVQEAQGCITVLRIQMASFFQALVALRLVLIDSGRAT